MAAISSLGAGSGIFTNDLVNKLVDAERAPTEMRLDRRESETQAEISAYGRIRSALESLRSPMEALSRPDSMSAFVASSSNEAILDVDVESSQASRGNYSLDVKQLAQAQSLASSEFVDRDTTQLGAGTLTLNVGGNTTNIVIDESNNTLEGIADAINGAKAGVSAGIVDTGNGYRLVMSSDESGSANEASISAADSDGNNTDSSGLSQFVFDDAVSNMKETVPAQNAILDVNGIEVTRSSNTVDGVVDGVAFNLKDTGVSVVKITQDAAEVAGRVQAFVDRFNALQDQIKSVSGFNLGSEQGGVLSGDSAIRGIQNDLRQMLTSVPPGLESSPVRMLADIGIKTEVSTGKLEFDEIKFQEQLEANPDAMTALFAESEAGDGIARQMVDSVETFLAGGGALAIRTEGLSKTLQRIEDDRIDLGDRIASYEERLIKQFSAADQVISRIQSTGSYVQQQLAALMPQRSGDN
ncbi:flagellar filament capping protein FliD [Marinobacter sp. LV10MA510-1]|uniref:flagellar filament capping protein FliD n=1 Tax=Marinobacter sp. LV10MA510-1 TaxID=1415567 RepID=UPI000BF8E980|nr:flagellar filament capping protein FliD [Marinobacter sp. LV10MA510-1]PFG11739.1 flagellar hook-associated protein 2 [Marinobacter sp. LV10MA510-1]